MPQSNILNYLPTVFAEVKEMIAHAVAEKPEIERLWTASDTAYEDQFLYTMSEYGIKRWEKILNISPLGTDSLEDRRFRIINRLNAQLPYTYRMMQNRLNQMCGADGYTMTYDADTWTLTVRVALTRKNQLADALKVIEEMLPVNIVLDFDLLYNSHVVLSRFTYAHLSAYTHSALYSEPLT